MTKMGVMEAESWPDNYDNGDPLFTYEKNM